MQPTRRGRPLRDRWQRLATYPGGTTRGRLVQGAPDRDAAGPQHVSVDHERLHAPVADVNLPDLTNALVCLDNASTTFLTIAAGLVASIPDPLAALRNGE